MRLSDLMCVNVHVEAQATQVKDAPDVLDKEKCLDALAELRHAKWFQVCTCALDFFIYFLTEHFSKTFQLFPLTYFLKSLRHTHIV